MENFVRHYPIGGRKSQDKNYEIGYFYTVGGEKIMKLSHLEINNFGPLVL